MDTTERVTYPSSMVSDLSVQPKQTLKRPDKIETLPYTPEPLRNGYFVHSPYCEIATSSRTIGQAMTILGVTKYRLMLLLGLPYYSDGLQWGKRNRIAPYYLQRIVYLIYLRVINNLDTSHIKAIDWDNGNVTYMEDKGTRV